MTRYRLKNGYIVDIYLARHNLDRYNPDCFVAHTNDYDAYQKIDHRWYPTRAEAEQHLDEIAKIEGWEAVK